MSIIPDLPEIAGLIGPSDQDRDYWREQAIRAADAAFWRGWDQGRRALLDEQQDERVKTARRIEQETAAYGPGGRARFADARPGDYPGRGTRTSGTVPGD